MPAAEDASVLKQTGNMHVKNGCFADPVSLYKKYAESAAHKDAVYPSNLNAALFELGDYPAYISGRQEELWFISGEQLLTPASFSQTFQMFESWYEEWHHRQIGQDDPMSINPKEKNPLNFNALTAERRSHLAFLFAGVGDSDSSHLWLDDRTAHDRGVLKVDQEPTKESPCPFHLSRYLSDYTGPRSGHSRPTWPNEEIKATAFYVYVASVMLLVCYPKPRLKNPSTISSPPSNRPFATADMDLHRSINHLQSSRQLNLLKTKAHLKSIRVCLSKIGLAGLNTFGMGFNDRIEEILDDRDKLAKESNWDNDNSVSNEYEANLFKKIKALIPPPMVLETCPPLGEVWRATRAVQDGSPAEFQGDNIDESISRIEATYLEAEHVIVCIPFPLFHFGRIGRRKRGVGYPDPSCLFSNFAGPMITYSIVTAVVDEDDETLNGKVQWEIVQGEMCQALLSIMYEAAEGYNSPTRVPAQGLCGFDRVTFLITTRRPLTALNSAIYVVPCLESDSQLSTLRTKNFVIPLLLYSKDIERFIEDRVT
ncbi:hypothetical protein D9758_003378 [Tetrapyrgos nigripes]|uniref:Uncharacterized protein n=1 Tax=Tetrapyrgos nigripes TaxID=182062 RepID=A0A8H5GV26_9AGAR|nr:hypothetical protein D9758_003378 [Tetrapyrgos nigripes]